MITAMCSFDIPPGKISQNKKKLYKFLLQKKKVASRNCLR